MRPILFSFGEIIIYSYPLFMGLALGVAHNVSRGFLTKYGDDLRGFNGLFWGATFFSWFGAKLFFLICSTKGDYSIYTGSSSFWLGGGFVFYGGLIFGTAYILIYSLLLKKFNIKKCHLFLPALCFAHGVGRIGCLMAGCCFGKESSVPWAILLHGARRHPVQLYESLSLFSLGFLLIWMIRRKEDYRLIVAVYFLSYAFLRFFLEFFRGDRIRGLHFFDLSTSQYVSAAIVILLLSVSLCVFRKVKR